MSSLPSLRYCPSCGSRAESDARFCSGCGRPLSAGASDEDPVTGEAAGLPDLGTIGIDVSFDLVVDVPLMVLALRSMSRIENGTVVPQAGAGAYGLARVALSWPRTATANDSPRMNSARLPLLHRDDYRAIQWLLEEASIPAGIDIWVMYQPDRGRPELASMRIVLMREGAKDASDITVVKEPQQRLDL